MSDFGWRWRETGLQRWGWSGIEVVLEMKNDWTLGVKRKTGLGQWTENGFLKWM